MKIKFTIAVVLILALASMVFANAGEHHLRDEFQKLIGVWVEKNGEPYPRLEFRKGDPDGWNRKGTLRLDGEAAGEVEFDDDQEDRRVLIKKYRTNAGSDTKYIMTFITYKTGKPEKLVISGGYGYIEKEGDIPEALNFTLVREGMAKAPKPAQKPKTEQKPAPAAKTDIPDESEDDMGGAINITLNNNRSHSISFAFCWSGFDSEDDRRMGWFNVNAGESTTVTLPAHPALTRDTFGYYAQGGGYTWAGDMRQVIIDPQNVFDGHPDDPIAGGKKVGFRKVNVNENGTATLTFNESAGAANKAPAANKDFSAEELEAMSAFLSSFSEQGLLNVPKMTIDDWIRFGIKHNYINNYKNTIDRCKVKNCPYGGLTIESDYVFETVRKFSGDDMGEIFREGNIRYKYNEEDGYYHDLENWTIHFAAPEEGDVYYARVTDAKKTADEVSGTVFFNMKGYYYNSEDANDRNGTFIAVAVPYNYDGEDTWELRKIEWSESN